VCTKNNFHIPSPWEGGGKHYNPDLILVDKRQKEIEVTVSSATKMFSVFVFRLKISVFEEWTHVILQKVTVKIFLFF